MFASRKFYKGHLLLKNMRLVKAYERAKEGLLESKDICKENRKIIKDFFEFEERKLKRQNGLVHLDESNYLTLHTYIQKIKNINKWFKNKPWKKLSEKDIRQVYDDLEDGKIKNERGKPFKDRQSYYNKCFKSKLFDLAGKKKLAQKVIEFSTKQETAVRFIEIEAFRKLVDVAGQTSHKFLLWLAFDIGENVSTLLKLQKKDFVRRINPDTKEPEYIVNLPAEKLKRSRTARSEITNFKETVDFADIVLDGKKADDKIFSFGHRQAEKMLDRAAKITNARCIPKGEMATLKDLRSSMACYLLKEGWTTDEVKARLGHRPSSRVIDRYATYLAIGRHKIKKKLYDSSLHKINDELEESKKREILLTRRMERLKEEQETAAGRMAKLEEYDKKVAGKVDELHDLFKRYPKIARQLARKPGAAKVFSPFSEDI